MSVASSADPLGQFSEQVSADSENLKADILNTSYLKVKGM
jgi:hypothetical protein